MSWRTVVISHTAKLDYQIGYLVVRGQETIKIHLSEIGILVVESTAVSMTAYLLSELVKKKIKVIFCDEKRNPSSELISYYGSHDTSVKIRRQMEWSREEKATLWTEIVSEKIRKQAELLEQYGKTEAELLYQYIERTSSPICGRCSCVSCSAFTPSCSRRSASSSMWAVRSAACRCPSSATRARLWCGTRRRRLTWQSIK